MNTHDESVELKTTSDTVVQEQIKKYKNLVMSGGGIKGIAHIGALYALQQLNYLDTIEEFSGTSVGSLILMLYVIGYTPAELYDFIKIFDMSKTRDISIANIQKFGLDSGDRIEYVLKKLIVKKGLHENITLKELFEINKKKLILTTVCVNTMDVCYVSYENFPNVPLYVAVRMSTSIPFIYCPVKYENNYYMDGASFDNYPFNPFKNKIEDTLGLLLIDSKNKVDNIDDLETYILRVLNCISSGMDYHAKKGYEKNTVEIHVENINVIIFNVTDEKKDELFLKGYNAVMNHIKPT